MTKLCPHCGLKVKVLPALAPENRGKFWYFIGHICKRKGGL